ncbi:uncharacterized protein LOC136041549 isoform X2 [Artemia franciscana]|uniref:uncharacterized protein LOC136041549 isoform X2 n=1 Tax=Artemia franciscana TaxID=6661 RepID=UPI0032D9D654
MLVDWLLSELDELNYQRHSLVQLEVRQLIINFYTMLLHAGAIRPVEDGNINGVDMDFEIMQQVRSYAPVQSPGSSPLYPASVTLSVGTSHKSPMSQTAIHPSQTQRSQHIYMSRFHTNIFQL